MVDWLATNGDLTTSLAQELIVQLSNCKREKMWGLLWWWSRQQVISLFLFNGGGGSTPQVHHVPLLDILNIQYEVFTPCIIFILCIYHLIETAL